MSNGYPHSHSPLGGSPSPGPSPGIGGQNKNYYNRSHNNKCKHAVFVEQINLCSFNFKYAIVFFLNTTNLRSHF